MDLLRRMSTKPDTVDEEQIRQLSQQRRTSSFATTALHDEPVLPSAVSPPIEIFPGTISTKQETLLFTPSAIARGFIITYARTGKHVLTAVSSSTPLPGPSHTKSFYGTLDMSRVNSTRENNDSRSSSEDRYTKLCTLTRDSMSFRKRHHVDDPYNKRRLIEMEFSVSSWNSRELKANIELMSKYSDSQPMEPIRLRWRGNRASLEGVLEWNGRPVAVCAKGPDTEEGEYVVYVAPGMDVYVCSIVVMAIDDRTRRGSDDKDAPNGLIGRRESESIQ